MCPGVRGRNSDSAHWAAAATVLCSGAMHMLFLLFCGLHSEKRFPIILSHWRMLRSKLDSSCHCCRRLTHVALPQLA